MKIIWGTVLATALVTVPAAASAQKNVFADAWRDNMVKQVQTAYDSLQKIQADVVRLQSELKKQGGRVAPGGKCARLDCKDLDALARLAANAEAAALTTFRLNEIALKQRRRQAKAAADIASAIRKGKEVQERALFWQEVAKGVAELTINIGVAMATGDPEAATSAIHKVATATANFAANKAIDRATGTSSGARAGAAEVTKNLGGPPIIENIATSLSSQLVRIGVFDTQESGAARKLVFKPQLFLETVPNYDTMTLHKSWTAKDGKKTIKTLNTMPAVIDTVARTVMEVITGPAIGQTEEFVERARREFTQAVDDQKVYVEAATLQAAYTRTARKIWQNHQRTREAIDRLRSDCHSSVRRGNCAERLNAVLKSAESAFSARTKAITSRRNDATRAVDRARGLWLKQMAEANIAHGELAAARDRLAETERLSANRDRITQLARGAPDADTRQKYRRQLNQLDAAPSIADQRATVTRLAEKREALWKGIEMQRAAVSRLRAAALKIYSETENAMTAAEADHRSSLVAAQAQLYDCMGVRPPSIDPKFASLGKLRDANKSSTLLPSEIFGPLNQSLAAVSEQSAKTAIRVEMVEGDACLKVAKRLDGCWYDISRSGDSDRSDPVIIATRGNKVEMTYGKSGRVYRGQLTSGVLKTAYPITGAAELAQPHWWQSGPKPPLKVARQVYPKYKESRNTLTVAKDRDSMTGMFHGAYVRWDKETFQVSSFENRDYPAKFVRDHKLKLRSVGFVDRSVDLSGPVSIRAKAVSGCAAVIDTVRVKAYLNNDDANFVWAELRETAPGSLEFKGTVSSLSVLSARMANRDIKSVTVFDPKALRGGSAAVK